MGISSSSLVSWAAKEGRVDDLIYHLNRSDKIALKPSVHSTKKRSPLHLAAIGGHTQCISILYDAGANLNEKDADGLVPLHHAANNGHLVAVQLLLQLGADIEASTRFGMTAIHFAAGSGHTPMVRVLGSNHVTINAQESWGQTPLIISTQRCRHDCMVELLLAGVNKEIHDRYHGYTALHTAVITRDEETVLLLLDAGCDVHAIDNQGLSTLGVAILNKFYAGIPLLIEYGARMNVKDWEITSPPLKIYIHKLTGTPLSLARLSRVVVRKMLGPQNISAVTKLQLTAPVQQFLVQIRDDCCSSNEAKRHALQPIACALEEKKSYIHL